MKKLLFSLFMCLFTLISFGNCDYLISNNSFTQDYRQNLSVQLNSSNEWKYTFSYYGVYCNKGGDYSGDIAYYKSDGTFIGWLSPNACIYGGGNESYMYSNNHTNLNFYVVYMYLPGSIYTGSSNCEIMSSLDCQTNYSLIPVSDVDSSYCENNNLCPVSSTGDIVWSNLYINDILHIGSPSIFIDIPEEFSWDYEYYTGYLNIDIEGYNVDSQYIEGIIDTQKYVPTDTDFNKIITDLIPMFIPGLVIILCLYFIFRFIKKVF